MRSDDDDDWDDYGNDDMIIIMMRTAVAFSVVTLVWQVRSQESLLRDLHSRASFIF